VSHSDILLAAAGHGSPALHALVLGHLASARPEMALAALGLPAEHLAVLDAWFVHAMKRARDAGAIAALHAMTDFGE
jgi:hypothetical protein